jgi:hypothetical protein
VPFVDFLRAAVLVFAGTGTVLAAVSIGAAQAEDDDVLLYVAFGWWAVAALAGLWFGRGARASGGIRRLIAAARAAPGLPEVDPGGVMLERLWPVAAFAVVAGALAALFPQVPAIGAGYALAAALAWRNQSRAVLAIEGRDGVRFYVEKGSALRSLRLVRTPGFRIETALEPDDPVGAAP